MTNTSRRETPPIYIYILLRWKKPDKNFLHFTIENRKLAATEFYEISLYLIITFLVSYTFVITVYVSAYTVYKLACPS